MRKKITIGFMSLAVVLLLAGAISMYELQRLRSQAEQVLETNSRNIELAERMLDALQRQNSSILRMTLADINIPDTGYDIGCESFDKAYAEAIEASGNSEEMINIAMANTEYRNVISNHLLNDEIEDREWFLSTYLQAYYKLDEALKSHITSPENSVQIRTQMLEKNAYKTITPSILTMLVAIIIVMMFYYFVDHYYAHPIIKLHNSLKNYLSFNVPFAPKFESNDDELQGLRDMISELIDRKKNSQK